MGCLSKSQPLSQAYPDVSAQSDRFEIFFQGHLVHIGGTSASAPTVAGIVALLNDARLSQGKSTLGFLNPFLYQTAAKSKGALNDITVGNNPGCGTQGFNVRILLFSRLLRADSAALLSPLTGYYGMGSCHRLGYAELWQAERPCHQEELKVPPRPHLTS